VYAKNMFSLAPHYSLITCEKSILLSCQGTTRDSLSCVRFGLITDDTDLEELIGLVYSTGREIEDSSKVRACYKYLHTAFKFYNPQGRT